MLVSKVVQNLANGVRFGQKEPFMEPMNEVRSELILDLRFNLMIVGFGGFCSFCWMDSISFFVLF